MIRPRAFLMAFAIAAAASSPLQATIVFTPGNNPQPGESNVLFLDQGPISTVVGSLSGGTDNFNVTGTTALAGDQLISKTNVITGSGSDLVSATFTPTGGTLDFLIFDVFDPSASLTIDAKDAFGNDFILSGFGGIGQNFISVQALAGETIKSVTVSSTGSFSSLSSIRGIFVPAVGAVPEPSTWAMMLSGFFAIGFAIRRKQSGCFAT